FEKTCEMLRKWIDNGKKVIPLSVNVSKIQINNSKFLDTYLSIKNKYNIPSGLIEIELTESILFDNIEMMLEMLKFFKENGICVSIDDFGSG
ncbi:MAG: EAL domain-containing protein, partial [Oscillospiraceae bacterium]